MIKLFWNTHNLNIPDQNNKTDKDIVDHNWGIYHKKYSDKWVFEILKKIKFDFIKSEEDLEKNDVLIIVDSGIEKKANYYTKLNLICSKMFLIHLGDEFGVFDLSKIYSNFNFIWRSFCSNRYFNNDKVKCLPIGYKSGVCLNNNKEVSRKYKWAFVGTPHKSSRHDLIHQLSEIKPFFSHQTNKFNEKIISVEKMSEILSSTEFIPCPNGFHHPETYRVYEALECECIPIVENAYKYYDRLFPKNPFLKIDKWQDAKKIIMEWDTKKIKEKRKECKIWWNDYKNKYQEDMVMRIMHAGK